MAMDPGCTKGPKADPRGGHSLGPRKIEQTHASTLTRGMDSMAFVQQRIMQGVINNGVCLGNAIQEIVQESTA